ncbi:MAG: hypothetical protein Q7T89_03560 [Anaerolineales bacterium]|nr:hypothetical protein [Anaerolineales bacterium]
MLSTWKPCGLAQRVRFSGLPRTEAGIYPDETNGQQDLTCLRKRLTLRVTCPREDAAGLKPVLSTWKPCGLSAGATSPL